MVKERQTNVKHMDTSSSSVFKAINKPSFIHIEEIGQGVCEVENAKKKIYLDVPIQVGIDVYSQRMAA